LDNNANTALLIIVALWIDPQASLPWPIEDGIAPRYPTPGPGSMQMQTEAGEEEFPLLGYAISPTPSLFSFFLFAKLIPSVVLPETIPSRPFKM